MNDCVKDSFINETIEWLDYWLNQIGADKNHDIGGRINQLLTSTM